MGVFADALGSLRSEGRGIPPGKSPIRPGLAAWLLRRFRPQSDSVPRLRILERIRLTPRQALILVEVDGERLLMATSDASAPAFYPVKGIARVSRQSDRRSIPIAGTCS
ncbi:MAG: flagellar biosynthetic protein FliO [Acidobacteria bacterium]|nr:flagellar biosynthetic protein FliO [Acidobacteriota bacterium]